MGSLCDNYRPTALDDIAGNPKPRKVLGRLIAQPFASAWLLEGESGIGKTTAALCVAEALAGPLDLRHVNGCDVNAEAVRTWADSLRFAPCKADGWRVLVIDEADRMSHAAQVLFLSLLEQLPPRALVLFTSNERGDFEPRFLSRVKVLHFTTQGLAKAGASRLVNIATAEGFTITEAEAVKMLQKAKNNVRAAIQALELRAMLEAA